MIPLIFFGCICAGYVISIPVRRMLINYGII